MPRLPQDELKAVLSLTAGDEQLDNQTSLRLKKRLADEFRTQLTFGVPTNADEARLRRLSAQLKSGKLVVKLFLRHPLHAKLYLLFRPDPINPIIGYLGSSNLTFSGLSYQGELNVDVLDHDAANKLVQWFEARWADRWCIDITAELIQVIDERWAREESLPPYHIHVKMAYHLAQEARAGLSEFRIPPEFGNRLFDYQVAAVKIAAHHLNKRGGVLIGDVVGLGKTLMATALTAILWFASGQTGLDDAVWFEPVQRGLASSSTVDRGLALQLASKLSSQNQERLVNHVNVRSQTRALWRDCTELGSCLNTRLVQHWVYWHDVI